MTEDLPIENAFTHTGIFLAWCINHDLVSGEFIDDFADEAKQLKSIPRKRPNIVYGNH